MDTHIIEPAIQVNTLAAEQSISLKGYLADHESREALRAATKALDFTTTVATGTINTAIKALDGVRCPTVLVVDLTGVDFELAAMEALANVCEPNVRVIAVGERNDIFLYRRLKAMGVAEYLYKPVNQEYFEQALRDVTGRSSQRAKARLGKLVVTVGANGGVGTTTLAVNLASHLSTVARRRVALLDLDLFSETTSLLLNTVPNTALCEALDNPERVDNKFLERAMLQVTERLDVMGSDGEKQPLNGLTHEGVLIVMEHLQSLYHYTVADIPTAVASADPGLLTGADTVFVVCDGSVSSARNTARLLRTLTPSCPTVHTVLNRAGAPGQISRTDLEKVIGRAADVVIPYLPKNFSTAALLGTPAASSDRKVKSAIGRLAREVSGQEQSKPSFLDRMLRR